MKKTACVWCSSIMEVPDTYNDLQFKGVCSPTCKAAETIFCEHYDDREIRRRAMFDKYEEKLKKGKKVK